MEGVTFTDRYEVLGIKRPNLLTMCRGHCEATGVVPVYMPEGDTRLSPLAVLEENERHPDLILAWRTAEAERPSYDGWHFVRCPDCKGTGRTRGLAPRAKQVGFWARKKWEFARRHVLVRPYTAATAARVLRMQHEAPSEAFQVGGQPEPPPWHRLAPYGDRLDVPRPWLWNRRIAIRVLLGRTR
jgi:hypothetical protein